MRLSALSLLLGVTFLAVSGCRFTGFYLNNPRNPLAGVRRVAVVAVEGRSSRDPVDLGEILASELVQFPGIEAVVRPAEVQSTARKNDLSLVDERSIRTLGRLSGADAVLVAELTEYNPYNPPRIAVAAQLFFTEPDAASDRTYIDLSAQGRARPIAALDRTGLIQIEKVYDGSQRETRDLAAAYARGHRIEDEAIDGADRVLWIPDLYFRFVSNCLVRDLFADYQARREAAKANGKS